MVGTTFSTGNSTVAKLPKGSVLKVSGQGQLEIVEVPKVVVEVKPGVEFISKRGNHAVVVDLTSTGGLNAAQAPGVVFYVEEGVNRVRRTSESFVQGAVLGDDDQDDSDDVEDDDNPF